jgi:hypothetical protein
VFIFGPSRYSNFMQTRREEIFHECCLKFAAERGLQPASLPVQKIHRSISFTR